MGDYTSGPNCCGCALRELTVNSWTVDSGSKSEASGTVTLNGQFTPNSVIDEEAYTVVINRLTGSFTFTIDGIDYQVSRSGNVTTVTADGESRSMDTTEIGNTSSPIHFQMRVTPTHVWLLAVQGTSDLTPDSENRISADGTLYTIVQYDLTSPTSIEWTLTANGTYRNLWVASSTVQIGAYETVTKNCFKKPSLQTTYQGYLCLRGPASNETDWPGYLFPDAGSSGNNLTYSGHLIDEQYWSGTTLSFLYEDIEIKNGRDFCGFQLDGAGSSIGEADGTTYGSSVSGIGYNAFAGHPQRRARQTQYAPDGITVWSVGIFLRPLEPKIIGGVGILFPEETNATPYPDPIFRATLSFVAEFRQPDGERLTFGNIYNDSFTYEYGTFDYPGDVTVADIPINDLASVPHTLYHEGVDYGTSENVTYPPSSYADDDWGQFDATMTVYWNVSTS